MENEQLLSAVTQMLEEQKQYAVQQEKTNIALKNIEAQISSLESYIRNAKILSPDIGTEKLQEDIIQIKKQLSDMSKNIVQEKRYLLFPEYNAKEYYSTILKWVLYMIIATYACYLIRILIENLG